MSYSHPTNTCMHIPNPIHPKPKHKQMLTSELVFIPAPGFGHLPQTVELAKLLLHRDQRLSVTIITMELPVFGEIKPKIETQSSIPRLHFVEIPCDESTRALITPNTFLCDILEHQKPHFRNIVRGITESDSVRLAGFIIDMFCIHLIDLANEFGVPTYTYFTCPTSMLNLMFCLQAKHDYEGYDVTELENSSESLCVPGFVNPVPVKVLPELFFNKEAGYKVYLEMARKFRESNGIILNTFQDLESYGLEYLLTSGLDIPPVFPVGPIMNLEKKKNDTKNDEIMRWLNEQPESSVLFLCFGSIGTFNDKQVKEMAVAIERSGHRFLWSLRQAPPKGSMEYPREYENLEEVLPEGFLERTRSVGKVIGWAPQTAVLAHPSVGGFVSHCGWNSTLESMWFGVPMAAWPAYSEQQLNAFLLVVELGLAAEIRMDYLMDTTTEREREVIFVTAEEIEGGIRKMMSDGEMRKKVKDMHEKCRSAVVEGGSSYAAVRKFIDHLLMQ